MRIMSDAALNWIDSEQTSKTATMGTFRAFVIRELRSYGMGVSTLKTAPSKKPRVRHPALL